MNKILFFYLNTIVLYGFLCDLVRFCHLPKKGEIVELYSMLLIISPFMFWEDPKTFSKSIISLLILARKRISRIALAVRKNLKQLLSWNLSHLCLETVLLLPKNIFLLAKY